MFGFCGASRTGKSTLAKIVAEQTGFHFHTFNTAEIMKKRGFDVLAPLDFDTRLAAQNAYLDHYEEAIETLPRPSLTDRTPLCLAGYLMSEITMTNTSPEQGERAAEYLRRAIDIVERSFAMVFLLRPLGHYEVADGKHPANEGFQWTSQLVMEGAASQLRVCPIAKLMSTDLELRAGACTKAIIDRLEEFATRRELHPLH